MSDRKKTDGLWEQEWKKEIAEAKEQLAQKTAECEALSSVAQKNTTERVKQLEDVLAAMMNDLHVVRKQLKDYDVGRRCGNWYEKVRELLGDRGQEVDRTLRS